MTRAIYLANPYGFSLQQKAALLPPIVDALESLGLEVGACPGFPDSSGVEITRHQCQW